jgi:hypothetical protein
MNHIETELVAHLEGIQKCVDSLSASRKQYEKANGDLQESNLYLAKNLQETRDDIDTLSKICCISFILLASSVVTNIILFVCISKVMK